MNKKRLSVVMAGAMLASSVAPIMAAEEVTIPEAQKGNLITEITDLLFDAPRFSKDVRNTIGSDRKEGSVYTVKINGEENTTIYAATKGDKLKSTFQKTVQTEINKLKVGDKVELVALGYREDKDAKGNKLILSSEESKTYTKANLTEDKAGSIEAELDDLEDNHLTQYGYIIESRGYNENSGEYVIKLKSDAAKAYGEETIVLKENSPRLDFTKFIKSDASTDEIGNLTSAGDFYGFPTKTINVDIADKVEKTYKIATDGTTLALSDIFDGVMLTEKGYALLNAAKETQYVLNVKKVNNDLNTATNRIVKINGNEDFSTGMAATPVDKNGVYSVKVEIANANKATETAKEGSIWSPKNTDYDTYYITGTSKAQLEKVLGWIDGLNPDVEEIAGAERYSTAVKIAKELAKLTDVAEGKDIVLVNGNSLVDGLAAAPLAEHLGEGVTPILLTENDKLPTATKKYLSELVDAARNNTITVNIVGGDGVVSKSVEKELKDLNLKVKRFGGSDREATSMAVAEEIGFDNGAFVVGATGEADAMSIAGYAADKIAPIVVSGFNGLSDDTLYELEDQRVTVIGGDSQISEADYAAIKDVALTLGRVSGSDRKETNAEVIRRYYANSFAGTKTVVVAKDDVLIDALTSANLAAKKNAPIVLGTKELSKNQVEAIAKNANGSKGAKVYQVGYGEERSVVKTVAQALGLI